MAIVFGIAVIGIFLTLSVAPAVKAQDGTLEWYYDNLTDDDRKKIRQAFDFCIPRDQIISGLHQGYAVATATSINQQLTGYYDPTVEARSYNQTKALELLTEVFGYEWNTSAPTYFDMVLSAPTTNAARTQWAALIALSLANVGVNTDVKWWTWSIIIPRIFTDPAGVGNDYRHGGYDAYFIGWSSSADIDHSSMFVDDYFVPNGDNAAWINNSEVNALWDQALYNTSVAARIQAIKDYQAWYYENVPMSIIRQSIDLFALDPDLAGFDTYLQGYYFQNLTHPSQTEITYTVPGEFVDYNPLISNSYYDFCAIANAHYGLSSRRGAYNLTHPVPTPITQSWNSSVDGLVWDVQLTQGLMFSNGNSFNASDVVFSYQSAFDEDIGSSSRATVLTIFGEASNIQALDEYTVRFTLPQFYPYMSTAGLGLSILDKEEFDGYGISPADWSTHVSNTGYTPAGLGPYVIDEYTGDYRVHLSPNPYHIGFSDAGAVGGGIYWQNATLNVTLDVVKDPNAAFVGLEAGTYDAIDAQTGLQAYADDIIASSNAELVSELEYGWQELVYNQMSPIWGMNAGDPREMYPEDYTTEAPITVISTVISGETIYETITIVQSPGFGAIVLLAATGSLAFLYKKKRK